MNRSLRSSVLLASSLLLAAAACKDKAARPAAEPVGKPASNPPSPAPASDAGSAEQPAAAGSAGTEPAAAKPPPKECWGTYEIKGVRTLTFSGAPRPEPDAAEDDIGADVLLSEDFKLTGTGGCAIVVHYDVSGGHSADPITHLIKLTVAADGKYTGTVTIQGDLDPATQDKAEIKEFSGTRKPAAP
jgi:hypothetical protein